uniref:TNFR-Cys domain-containing protein n=1 Tax=Strigamia maritima TaxID=126957 RepID=T1JA59_STRMM
MKWIVVLILFFFRNEIESLTEESPHKILYTLCGCPFGYFEVSRFVLSSDTAPPNCTNKSPLRKLKRTLEGYQCHKCHPSCLGCHGATDGDCSQCANDYFRASSYVQENVNNSHALKGNGEVVTVYDSQMNLMKRDKRQAEETGLPEYKLQEDGESIDKDFSDGVLKDFLRDVDADDLLTLDPTKSQKSTDGAGEYDLGSGDAETEDQIPSALKASLTTENFPIESVSTPREIRSTEAIFPNKETVHQMEIFEKVLFSPSPMPPPTTGPTVKQSSVRKTPATQSSTTQSITTQSTTTQSTTTTRSTTIQSTTTQSTSTQSTTTKTMLTKSKTRRPKTRKPKLTTTTVSPVDEAEFSQIQAVFWCVSTCPEGSYADEAKQTCLPCDSKCQTCLGPSFMNCTACASTSVRVSVVRRSSGSMKNLKTITCLSYCPLNEFDNNGTCTLCHDYCNGCSNQSISGCINCKYSKNEKDDTCSGPESDPLSALEIILPIVFVLILVAFTVAICLRWNGFFNMKKLHKMPFNYLSKCRNPSTKEEPKSAPTGLTKEFILRKNVNEYITNPPFPKACSTITEDGYELPLQPQPGPSGFGSRDIPSNSSSMRSIKPRRNDPLPPTPLELRAALHRKNSYLYDHYWRVINPTLYLIYRMFIIVYTILVWMYAIINLQKFAFIYLTIWSYTILTLNCFVRGFATSRYFDWMKIEDALENNENTASNPRPQVDEPRALPWLLQFSWLLTNIATPIGICVTVTFWAILYPAQHKYANMENIQLHAVNSVVLLIDFLLVAAPIRMIHIYQPIVFGCAYVSFNAIYWVFGGLNHLGEKAIYPITSWDKPVQTGLAILACLGLLIIIQIILVLLTNYLERFSTSKQRDQKMGFKCSIPPCKDLLLDCDEPKKLVQCRWRIINPTLYMIYRMCLVLYTIIVLILALTFLPEFSFIYLTIWSYTILTLNFLVRGLTTSRYFHWVKIEDALESENTVLIQRPPVDELQGLPWLVQFSWLLTNIATPIGICVTVIFWAALYPRMDVKMYKISGVGNIQLHAVNSLLLLVDFCIVAVPIRMVHIYQPIAFGFAYVSFNAIYWALGGLNPFGKKPIYPITDWDKPLETGLVILACLVLIIIIQIILVLLSSWLDRFSSRRQRASSNSQMPLGD